MTKTKNAGSKGAGMWRAHTRSHARFIALRDYFARCKKDIIIATVTECKSLKRAIQS